MPVRREGHLIDWAFYIPFMKEKLKAMRAERGKKFLDSLSTKPRQQDEGQGTAKIAKGNTPDKNEAANRAHFPENGLRSIVRSLQHDCNSDRYIRFNFNPACRFPCNFTLNKCTA